jgi:hypothetical protein
MFYRSCGAAVTDTTVRRISVENQRLAATYVKTGLLRNLENVTMQANSWGIRRMSDSESFHHALVSGWLGRAAA